MYTDNNAQGGFFMQQDANNPYAGGFNQQQQQQQHHQPMGGFPAPPQNNMGGGGGGYQGGQNNMYGGQPAQPQGGFNQTGYNNQNQAPTEKRRTKVFTPVSVKMVSNAQPRPDDVCEYDGDPINDIILCGRILRRIEEPMRTQFEINDNTGTFYVLFYHKGENQIPTALKNFQYEQFTYVKVYGNIRVFKEEKAIVGTHIKRIEKFDELTNHFLACYVSHCIRKKGVLKPRELAMAADQPNMQNMNNNANPGGNNSHNRSNEGSHNNNNQANQNVNQNVREGGFDIRKAIIEVMKQMTKTQKFVNKQHLFQLLQDRIDQGTFDREMDKMMNDGEICTAFDQNHYCLTN